MSRALPRTARALVHTWPRVLVLLLVVLVPCGHAGTHTVPVAAVASEKGGPPAECDLLDTAARPPARTGRRPVAPLRPAPSAPVRAPSATARPAPASTGAPGQPYALRSLRSVVLRC